jgi:hypothetical protein
MKHLAFRRIGMYLLALVMIVALPAGVLAQLGDDDEPRPGAPLSGDPSQYADPANPDDEGGEPQATDLILADVPSTLNYQGFLTNSSGMAFNGTVNILANLYNASAAGTLVWGPETINSVPVANGLFEIVLGATVPLTPDMFDEALYLELTINGTVMPRQPLRASAYAFGLVPGARVDGTPGSATYALTVNNRSTSAGSRGLFAQGYEYGLYVSETGTGDVAIYSPDYIRGRGFRSTEDSYLFAAGAQGSPWDDPANSQLIVDAQSSGTMKINARSAAGTYYFYLPIDTPAVLFGQPVTVEQLTVYYSVSNAASYITELSLEKGTGANSSTALLVSTTDLTSTTAASASYTPTDAALSSTSGHLMVRFVLTFANTSNSIYIGGIRLRLGHVPPP